MSQNKYNIIIKNHPLLWEIIQILGKDDLDNSINIYMVICNLRPACLLEGCGYIITNDGEHREKYKKLKPFLAKNAPHVKLYTCLVYNTKRVPESVVNDNLFEKFGDNANASENVRMLGKVLGFVNPMDVPANEYVASLRIYLIPFEKQYELVGQLFSGSSVDMVKLFDWFKEVDEKLGDTFALELAVRSEKGDKDPMELAEPIYNLFPNLVYNE